MIISQININPFIIESEKSEKSLACRGKSQYSPSGTIGGFFFSDKFILFIYLFNY